VVDAIVVVQDENTDVAGLEDTNTSPCSQTTVEEKELPPLASAGISTKTSKKAYSPGKSLF
jgi:hypothetical protein